MTTLTSLLQRKEEKLSTSTSTSSSTSIPTSISTTQEQIKSKEPVENKTTDIVEKCSNNNNNNNSKNECEEKTIYVYENLDNPKRFICSDDYKKELANLQNKVEYREFYSELYSRQMVKIKTQDTKKQGLRIMQFNVLADGLSGLYVNSKMKEKEFIGAPREALNFAFRGFRIVEEIMRHEPDIVTLQEVDQFEFFKHYLKGYEGLHAPKKSSPCVKIGEELGVKMLPDGVAIFYKSKDFKLVNSRLFGKYCNPKDEVDVPAVLLHLQRIEKQTSGPNEFIVVSTHLKSSKDMEGEKQRLTQIQYLAIEMLRYQQSVEKESHKNVPIFIGCDLNAPPEDTKGFPPLTYLSIVDSILFKKLIKEYKEKEKEKNKTEINMSNYEQTYNGLRFSSAYKCLNGSEPIYTTWKKRKGGEDKHTIDYVFFQKHKGVEVISLLGIPEEKMINTETLLPGWEYPSDHFAIMATFEF